MPEYLAPGVFVEEVSFRAKSIEGVSTSTTAFVGPTRRGPVARPDAQGHPGPVPEVLTSFLDFQRIYGGLEDLSFTGGARTNYLAHAVRAYFDNGGARLFVARVTGTGAATAQSSDVMTGVRFVCRTPGSCGNGKVDIVVNTQPVTVAALARAPLGSLARVGGTTPTMFLRGSDGVFKDGVGTAIANTATGV